MSTSMNSAGIDPAFPLSSHQSKPQENPVIISAALVPGAPGDRAAPWRRCPPPAGTLDRETHNAGA